MTVKSDRSPLNHFGRQVRKERTAHGWRLEDLAARTDLAVGYLSQIETGKRPPTRKVADAMDRVFTERKGWFTEYYEETKTWMPAGFRDWGEYEDAARELFVWSPGIIDGVAQTEAYARTLLSIHPDTAPEMVESRLKGRLVRQNRLLRQGGPRVVVLIQHVALYCAVGSAEVMAEQCAHLIKLTRLPNVTLHVVPPLATPIATASLMLTEEAAYTENALAGAVYTEAETVNRLRRLFDSVRAEVRPASESLAMIRRAGQAWTGAKAATAGATADSASK